MERDVSYIREELDEVTMTHLRRWIVVLEETQETKEPREIRHEQIPGFLAYLNAARNALCRAEKMAKKAFSETAFAQASAEEQLQDQELMGEDVNVDVTLSETINVEQVIVEEEVENGRARQGRCCGRPRGERGR
ncbi:hypothetical protein [Pseudovibrio exalbescens]|uniref:Uncharacterized protein n=1 Tax=Pseudovibrio exalbescens TaxID=197461 RepID=A0A1U7JKS7_9HYPH|nr:hypothetical protein [Pseudovibrio exalbescens]OKL45350.1 hypothetical protein A3843_03190 [Pseudovibrio exalbescens]